MSGHGLLDEGAAFGIARQGIRWTDRPIAGRHFRRLRAGTVSGEGRGVCACGAFSDYLPTSAARRRWHNEHKANPVTPPPATPTEENEE